MLYNCSFLNLYEPVMTKSIYKKYTMNFSRYLFIFILFSCKSPNLRLSVTQTTLLHELSGGSGIIKFGDKYYAVGDDTPYLFELDTQWAISQKVKLLETPTDSNGRIEKSLKPDFEAMEQIDSSHFIVLGSGSKSPQRDIMFKISIADSLVIEPYNLTDFYDKIKSLGLFKEDELNIEAAVYSKGHFYLFNRKPNVIFDFQWSELMGYLNGLNDFPEPNVKIFKLPYIQGVEAGFSGATCLQSESKIIFTASVENTGNAYDDGEILGSFVGTIDIVQGVISDTYQHTIFPSLLGVFKVESVTIESESSLKGTEVIFITDEDNGQSHIIQGFLKF